MSLQPQHKPRRRLLVSTLSLLALSGLIGGYVLLHLTQPREGKLSVLSTSQVTIDVGGVPSPGPSQPETSPTEAIPSPVAARTGRAPSIVTQPFTGTEEAATSATTGSTGPTGRNSSASSQSRPAATPTSIHTTGPANTGLLPPGLSLGETGQGGTGGGGNLPSSQPTSTATSGGAQSTSTPSTGATAVATATSGSPPTAAPTKTPQPPTATLVPEELLPIGHNSHLSMEGFVGPGAYKAGGIIVSNLGSVAFDYSVSMTVTGDQTFASLLRLRIYLRVGSTCDYPGQPDAGASTLKPLTGDQVGTVLYDGTFTTGNKIGDPAAFPATGDRHLNVGQSEVLCMEVFFPWTAGNQYQGQAVNGTQTFTAKSPDQ
jgi:hypothetical protein